MWDADNQRISGAKCALDVRHASIRPTLRKALQLIELVGQQASKTPVCSLNDMLCPGGATPPPHLSGWVVQEMPPNPEMPSSPRSSYR